MIKLKLKACIDNCTSLLIYDNTLEESDSNPTGWCNNNPNPNEIISGTIKIINPALEENIITLTPSDLPSTVTTDFLLQTVNLEGTGVYKIVYTVNVQDNSVSPSTTYTRIACTELFVACELRCCIDKMWVKVYDNNECCCNKKYMEMALEAESLYKALMNCAGSLNTTNRDKLIKKLERLCKLSECNCK